MRAGSGDEIGTRVEENSDVTNMRSALFSSVAVRTLAHNDEHMLQAIFDSCACRLFRVHSGFWHCLMSCYCNPVNKARGK